MAVGLNKGSGSGKKVFVFDYDDTLAWNECYYTRAETRLVNYMVEQFFPKCPKVFDIVQVFEKKDLANVKKYGLSTKRFPTSWLETYDHFCKEYGHQSSDWEKDEVESLAKTAFHIRPGLVQGAEEALTYLASTGDRLVLLTKGDSELQQKKLSLNSMSRWFKESDTRIVDLYKGDAFRKIMEESEAEFGKDGFTAYSVGNSYKSDITPAIDAGMKGIYVPFDTWYFDRKRRGDKTQKQKDTESGKLVVLDSIGGIKTNYKML